MNDVHYHEDVSVFDAGEDRVEQGQHILKKLGIKTRDGDDEIQKSRYLEGGPWDLC